jgi:DNA-binding transcriptional LysR family regulator
MDLNLVELFVDIVESRSLSAAARKRDMTRSNISQRLKLLEREVGAQLIRRSARSFELTQAGVALYDFGRRMCDELAATCASIDCLGQDLRGQVRISVPTGFGRFFLSAKLIEFAKAHPNVTLTVTFNNRIDDLIAAEVDVALRITSTSLPLDNVARRICAIEWKLYASSDYLATYGPVTSPVDLERHNMIAALDLGHRVSLTLTSRQDDKDAYTIGFRSAVQSTDYPFLADAVCKGMGIGLLPGYVSQEPAHHALVPVLPDYRVSGRQNTLYIVTVPNRYPSHATQALIDFLREAIVSISTTWN